MHTTDIKDNGTVTIYGFSVNSGSKILDVVTEIINLHLLSGKQNNYSNFLLLQAIVFNYLNILLHCLKRQDVSVNSIGLAALNYQQPLKWCMFSLFPS